MVDIRQQDVEGTVSILGAAELCSSNLAISLLCITNKLRIYFWILLSLAAALVVLGLTLLTALILIFCCCLALLDRSDIPRYSSGSEKLHSALLPVQQC